VTHPASPPLPVTVNAGRDPAEIERLWQKMFLFHRYRGEDHPFGVQRIDEALSYIKGKTHGVPVNQLRVSSILKSSLTTTYA
jgi:L-alanine-DL-glutamate epimerase-like enolase superfamily enzyme